MPHKDPEIRKAYRKAYYAAHREEILEKNKIWARTHPEKFAAYHAAYRVEHRAETRAYNALYGALHRDELNQREAERRAACPEKLQIYRESHREELRAKNRARYNANREKMLAKDRAYYARHPEKMRLKRSAYQKMHPEKYRAKEKRRRAQKHGSLLNDFTHAQWIELQAAFDHRCAYCGKRAKGHLTQDHITPLIDHGPHTLSNIVPACRSCNSKKHNGPPLCPVQPVML